MDVPLPMGKTNSSFATAALHDVDATHSGNAPEPFLCRLRLPSEQPHGFADRRALRNGRDCTIIDVKKQESRPLGNLSRGMHQEQREENHGRR